MNWLKYFLDGAGHTYLSFATAMGVSDKTVQRWATYKSKSRPGPDRFAKMANLLDLDVSVLTSAYEENAPNPGQADSPIADEILAELEPLEHTDLIPAMASALGLDTCILDEVAQALARRLEDPAVRPGFVDGFYQPFSDAIDDAGKDVKKLCMLRQCLEGLIQAAVDGLEMGKPSRYHLEHNQDMFEIRVALSRTLRRKGLGMLKAKDDSNIDRSFSSLRGWSMEGITETEADRRFYEIVRKLSSDMCMDEEVPPLDPVNGSERFRDHCRKLVRKLAPLTRGNEFPFLRIYNDEDPKVQTRLIDMFQSLPLVVSGPGATETSLFRVGSVDDLEGCIAKLLFDIDLVLDGADCRQKQTHNPRPQETQTEETAMHSNHTHSGFTNSGTMIVHGPLTIGDRNKIEQRQLIEKEIEQEIEALLAATTKTDHEIRKLLRDLQSALETPGAAPQPGIISRIKSLAAGLQSADKAVSSVTKIAGSLEQLSELVK